MALRVLDRPYRPTAAASREDFELAAAWANTRMLRFADGPDEVHREAIAAGVEEIRAGGRRDLLKPF